MAEPLRDNVIPLRPRTGRHSQRGHVTDAQAVLDDWDRTARLRGYADMGQMLLALVTTVLQQGENHSQIPAAPESGPLAGVQYREP